MIGGTLTPDPGSPQRWFYVSAINCFASALQINEWCQLNELLRSFAWVDVACNLAGESIWNEVKQAKGYFLADFTVDWN